MNETKIKADELLAYAMKLAKFTTAPPTFDSGTIGPNNFIWPAEDMLRRGMLAIASLNKEKLLGENPTGDDKDKDALFTDEELKEHKDNSVGPGERKGSFGGSYGDNVDADGDEDLDLDLFDPDAE